MSWETDCLPSTCERTRLIRALSSTSIDATRPQVCGETKCQRWSIKKTPT